MNILVACEESQRVTVEFRRLGHNAFSCDIIDQSGGASGVAYNARRFTIAERQL